MLICPCMYLNGFRGRLHVRAPPITETPSLYRNGAANLPPLRALHKIFGLNGPANYIDFRGAMLFALAEENGLPFPMMLAGN